jgi:hypothetical protein
LGVFSPMANALEGLRPEVAGEKTWLN